LNLSDIEKQLLGKLKKFYNVETLEDLVFVQDKQIRSLQTKLEEYRNLLEHLGLEPRVLQRVREG
jgi:hypothetical protein